MNHAPRQYIICYDITDKKRLQKVHRLLQDEAMAIEYSVFLLTATPSVKQKIINALKKLIDPKSDDLRCYPLPQNSTQIRLGKSPLPEGILFTDLPDDTRHSRRETKLRKKQASAPEIIDNGIFLLETPK